VQPGYEAFGRVAVQLEVFRAAEDVGLHVVVRRPLPEQAHPALQPGHVDGPAQVALVPRLHHLNLGIERYLGDGRRLRGRRGLDARPAAAPRTAAGRHPGPPAHQGRPGPVAPTARGVARPAVSAVSALALPRRRSTRGSARGRWLLPGGRWGPGPRRLRW